VRAHLRLVPAVVLLGALLGELSGCGSGPGPVSNGQHRVTVVAKDFKLEVSDAHWPAGVTSVRFDNLGPDTHELVMFLAPRNSAAAMPMRMDGDTVDEDSAVLHKVIDETGTSPGGSQTVTVRLAPGHYVIICNMAGHYMAGMRQDVTVG